MCKSACATFRSRNVAHLTISFAKFGKRKFTHALMCMPAIVASTDILHCFYFVFVRYKRSRYPRLRKVIHRRINAVVEWWICALCVLCHVGRTSTYHWRRKANEKTRPSLLSDNVTTNIEPIHELKFLENNKLNTLKSFFIRWFGQKWFGVPWVWQFFDYLLLLCIAKRRWRTN